MERGAQQAPVHEVAESDMIEQLTQYLESAWYPVSSK